MNKRFKNNNKQMKCHKNNNNKLKNKKNAEKIKLFTKKIFQI